MNIKTAGKGKNKLNIVFEGEDLTVPNLLKWELNQDEKVDIAGFKRDHPLLEDPGLIITSRQILPSTALKRATKSALNKVEELEKKFKK